MLAFQRRNHIISTLVPRLKPKHECTVIPQEVCQLKFDTPTQEVVPFMSKWCIDPNEEVVPDSTYDETQGSAILQKDNIDIHTNLYYHSGRWTENN